MKPVKVELFIFAYSISILIFLGCGLLLANQTSRNRHFNRPELSLAGLTLAADTYDKARRLYGEDFTVTGGRPQGARIWRIA